MKLLFDENLSHKLCNMLDDIFPSSIHIKNVGLEKGSDYEIWKYAKENDLMIVSKDIDFIDMSISNDNPPKIIWIRIGNTSTNKIEKTLRDNFIKIKNYSDDKENFILILK